MKMATTIVSGFACVMLANTHRLSLQLRRIRMGIDTGLLYNGIERQHNLISNCFFTDASESMTVSCSDDPDASIPITMAAILFKNGGKHHEQMSCMF